MSLTRVVRGGGVLDQTTTLATVVNTTTVTDLFTVALPAGRLQAGDIVRFVACGDLLNNSGGAATITIKVKLDTTTIMSVAISTATNANRQDWLVDMTFHVIASNSQLCMGYLFVSNNTNASNASLTTGNCHIGNQATAVDTSSVSKLVHVEVTHGTAASTIDVRGKAASLVLHREAA